MTRLEEIEKAIAKLPADEIAKLRDWFYAFDAERWDDQIARDAEAGKLDEIADQAVRDHKAGRSRAL